MFEFVCIRCHRHKIRRLKFALTRHLFYCQFQMYFSVKLTMATMIMIAGMMMFPKSEAGIGDCWSTWSRCTKWSRFFTGKLWLSCQQRCFCLGYATGECTEVPSSCPFTNKAWQCQCSGTRHGSTPSWCGF